MGSNSSVETHTSNSLMSPSEIADLYRQIKFEYPFLEDVFQTSVIVTDNKRDNFIIYINDTFEILTGYKKKEILGKNCRFLQGPHTDLKTLDTIRQSIREGLPLDTVILNYRKTGEAFWNSLLLLPVHKQGMKAGTVLYFLGILTNVTTLRFDNNPSNWDPPVVAMWLEKIKLNKYARAFIYQTIDGDDLVNKMGNFDFVHELDKPILEKKIRRLLEKGKKESVFETEKNIKNFDYQLENCMLPQAKFITEKLKKKKRKEKSKILQAWKQQTSATTMSHFPLFSLVPHNKHGTVENALLVGPGCAFVTFRNANVYGVYNLETNSWVYNTYTYKREKLCSCYPNFVSLHSGENPEDAEIMVLNALTLVVHTIKIWKDLPPREILGIYCNDECIILVVDNNLLKISYADLKCDEMKLENLMQIGKKIYLSSLKENIFLLSNQKCFQLWAINGKGELLLEGSSEEDLLLLVHDGLTVVGSTKKTLLIWDPPNNCTKLSHMFVTSITIRNDIIVVGDPTRNVTLYSRVEKKKIYVCNSPKTTNDVINQLQYQGLYSLAVFEDNFILSGSDKSIDIWDMRFQEQTYPISTIKAKGMVTQIHRENDDQSAFYFLLCFKTGQRVRHEVIKWELTKVKELKKAKKQKGLFDNSVSSLSSSYESDSQSISFSGSSMNESSSTSYGTPIRSRTAKSRTNSPLSGNSPSLIIKKMAYDESHSSTNSPSVARKKNKKLKLPKIKSDESTTSTTDSNTDNLPELRLPINIMGAVEESTPPDTPSSDVIYKRIQTFKTSKN